LITLGIIGIVAALTMPPFIQKHQKHVVETKLKRFYSNINQAFRLSEIDNGPKEEWIKDFFNLCDSIYSDNVFKEECLATIYNKYLKNYIKVTKTEYTTEIWGGSYLLYFADGSIVAMSYRGHDYIYFIDSNALKHKKVGKNMFPFGFYGSLLAMPRGKEFANKGVEPYISNGYDGTREFLKTNPENGAKLIQLNGWKIPDDYPFWD